MASFPVKADIRLVVRPSVFIDDNDVLPSAHSIRGNSYVSSLSPKANDDLDQFICVRIWKKWHAD